MEANRASQARRFSGSREGKKDPAAALLSLDWSGLARGAMLSAVRAVRAVRAVLLDSIRHMSGRLDHHDHHRRRWPDGRAGGQDV